MHTIGTFVSWLYEHYPLLYLGGSDECWLALSKMWVFADKINVVDFANDVMTAMWQKRKDQGMTISVTTLNWIWDNTMPNSIFRKFIVHASVEMSLSYIQTCGEDINSELLQDMLIRSRQSPDCKTVSRFDYFLREMANRPTTYNGVAIHHISKTHIIQRIIGKTWLLRLDGDSSEMELTLEDCWRSTETLFNAIRNLSVCEGVDSDNDSIFKLQQFVPKGANIDCLVFSGDSSGTDVQIRMGDDEKLKDMVAVACASLAVTACAEVKVVISYQ